MTDIKIKKKYSKEEWQKIESYFIDSLIEIKLTENPTSNDIKRNTAKIDAILTNALIINSYTKTNFEVLNTRISLIKQIYGGELKTKSKSSKDPTLTDLEAKGIARKKIFKEKIKDENNIFKDMSLNTRLTIYTERFNFMYSIVKSLQEKKTALIADSAMLKLESTINY